MNGLQSANAVYAQDGTRSAPMSASLNLVNGGVGHIDEQQRVMQNGQANGNHDDTGNGMVNATNGQGDNDGDNDDDEEENEDASSSQQGQKQNKPNGAGLARHGFDSSEETLRELESRYFLYYTDVSGFLVHLFFQLCQSCKFEQLVMHARLSDDPCYLNILAPPLSITYTDPTYHRRKSQIPSIHFTTRLAYKRQSQDRRRGISHLSTYRV